MSAYWDTTVLPSRREVRFIQKPHGIFGRYKQPPQNWRDRDAVKTVLRDRKLTWGKACAIARGSSSCLPG